MITQFRNLVYLIHMVTSMVYFVLGVTHTQSVVRRVTYYPTWVSTRHATAAYSWFLKSAFIQEVNTRLCMCVLCMCVCVLMIISSVMWHDMGSGPHMIG